MSEFEMIQLRPLSRDEDLPFRDPRESKDSRSPGVNAPRQPPPSMELESINQVMDTLYIPSYLPENFTLTKAMLLSNDSSQLRFDGSGSMRGTIIRLSQFKIPGHPMVKE